MPNNKKIETIYRKKDLITGKCKIKPCIEDRCPLFKNFLCIEEKKKVKEKNMLFMDNFFKKKVLRDKKGKEIIYIKSIRFYENNIIEYEIEDSFKTSTISFIMVVNFRNNKNAKIEQQNCHFITYNAQNANEIVQSLKREYGITLYPKKELEKLASQIYFRTNRRDQAFIGWKRKGNLEGKHFYYFNPSDLLSHSYSRKISVVKYLWADYTDEPCLYTDESCLDKDLLNKYFINMVGENHVTYMALFAATIFSINKPFFKEFIYPGKYNSKKKLTHLNKKEKQYLNNNFAIALEVKEITEKEQRQHLINIDMLWEIIYGYGILPEYFCQLFVFNDCPSDPIYHFTPSDKIDDYNDLDENYYEDEDDDLDENYYEDEDDENDYATNGYYYKSNYNYNENDSYEDDFYDEEDEYPGNDLFEEPKYPYCMFSYNKFLKTRAKKEIVNLPVLIKNFNSYKDYKSSKRTKKSELNYAENGDPIVPQDSYKYKMTKDQLSKYLILPSTFIFHNIEADSPNLLKFTLKYPLTNNFYSRQSYSLQKIIKDYISKIEDVINSNIINDKIEDEDDTKETKKNIKNSIQLFDGYFEEALKMFTAQGYDYNKIKKFAYLIASLLIFKNEYVKNLKISNKAQVFSSLEYGITLIKSYAKSTSKNESLTEKEIIYYFKNYIKSLYEKERIVKTKSENQSKDIIGWYDCKKELLYLKYHLYYNDFCEYVKNKYNHDFYKRKKEIQNGILYKNGFIKDAYQNASDSGNLHLNTRIVVVPGKNEKKEKETVLAIYYKTLNEYKK